MKIGNAIGLIAMVVMLSGCAENIDNVVYSDNQTQVDSQESVQLLIDEKEIDEVGCIDVEIAEAISWQ